jgi:hypothetical protein
MIDLLLEKHQEHWEQDKAYLWKLYFPYLFIQPDPGDIIVNDTTNEEYEILFVEEINPNMRRRSPGPFIKDHKRDSFSGLIILKEGTQAPNRTDKLYFKNSKNYISFFEWGPRKNVSHPAPSTSDGAEEQRGGFNPTITWSVKRVEPGTIGKRPFDPQKEVKPHVRDVFEDPAHTYLLDSKEHMDTLALQGGLHETGAPVAAITGNYEALTESQRRPDVSTQSIIVWGQWFDNLVQFDCWSTSNFEANRLIYWFEDFMDLYAPVLINNGVNQLLYWQRQQDQTIERWRDDIDNRTVQYYFRTEKLRLERKPNFRSFDLKLRIARPGEETILVGQPSGITTHTGVYGWSASDVQLDIFTGVHFTGASNYLWGSLDIQEGF